MKETRGDKIFRVVIAIILLFVNAIMLYPFILIISLSISDPEAVLRGEVTFLPKGFSGRAYEKMITTPNFVKSYGNTILYATVGTIITLALTALTAFPLSVTKFRSKKFLNVYYMITMFFYGGMIPTFLVVRGLGIIDTLWAMVLPGALTAYNIMIFRSFFQGIPESLHESAYIDGANDWRVLFSIILPLSKPVIATIALFTIVRHWNSFFNALLYLNTPDKYPLQMILRNILTGAEQLNKDSGAFETLAQSSVTESLKDASIIITTLPVICIYPFIQRYFVKGVMIGSVKG
ncbi:MAG: carbohydrate ABC transporter permease [Oscillospiraceae bacterium]